MNFVPNTVYLWYWHSLGYGGEDVSKAIEWKHKADFNNAGYTNLVVNSSYVGGQTRQYGNLSFTRIYESGHEGKTT